MICPKIQTFLDKKRPAKFSKLGRSLTFYSTMVRLKAKKIEIFAIFLIKFQFHYGTIMCLFSKNWSKDRGYKVIPQVFLSEF